MLSKIEKAVAYIKSKVDYDLDLAIVLGSGLGELADEIKNPIYIPYHEIPHFPTSSAAGHKGRMVIG
ncbi:MAG: purine-nucleoside phosphorylase, partial [Spirochaetes bacterium]|nr:purine-nucleoside phosphorylase [Spirochaetota bacterium]